MRVSVAGGGRVAAAGRRRAAGGVQPLDVGDVAEDARARMRRRLQEEPLDRAGHRRVHPGDLRAVNDAAVGGGPVRPQAVRADLREARIVEHRVRLLEHPRVGRGAAATGPARAAAAARAARRARRAGVDLHADRVVVDLERRATRHRDGRRQASRAASSTPSPVRRPCRSSSQPCRRPACPSRPSSRRSRSRAPRPRWCSLAAHR